MLGLSRLSYSLATNGQIPAGLGKLHRERDVTIMVVAHDSGTAGRASETVTRVEVNQEPSQYATFRIGYVSQPAMRILGKGVSSRRWTKPSRGPQQK